MWDEFILKHLPSCLPCFLLQLYQCSFDTLVSSKYMAFRIARNHFSSSHHHYTLVCELRCHESCHLMKVHQTLKTNILSSSTQGLLKDHPYCSVKICIHFQRKLF